MSEPSRPGDHPENQDRVESCRPNRRTRVFADYSIGLPPRAEALLSTETTGVLTPSRFQPEHTLVAALEQLGNGDSTEPVTVDPAFDGNGGD